MLQHSPEGKTDRAVLIAAKKAIIAIETVTGTFKEHAISKDDADALTVAARRLWFILEDNGYTIDFDSNRLVRTKK